MIDLLLSIGKGIMKVNWKIITHNDKCMHCTLMNPLKYTMGEISQSIATYLAISHTYPQIVATPWPDYEELELETAN